MDPSPARRPDDPDDRDRGRFPAGLSIDNENRASDSPYVERVYRSDGVPERTLMHSIAGTHWELAFAEHRGRLSVTVRGPETKPTSVFAEPETRWFGIVFAHGAFLPRLPVAGLVDSAVPAPVVTRRTFLLGECEWELPTLDNAEQFVERLVRSGLLVRDPLVGEVLAGAEPARRSLRSVQRRIGSTTGLTRRLIHQIERARQAAVLLGVGLSGLDVVHRLGYYDQPHLARSLTRFLGLSVRGLRDLSRREALSLLYKTDDGAAR